MPRRVALAMVKLCIASGRAPVLFISCLLVKPLFSWLLVLVVGRSSILPLGLARTVIFVAVRAAKLACSWERLFAPTADLSFAPPVEPLYWMKPQAARAVALNLILAVPNAKLLLRLMLLLVQVVDNHFRQVPFSPFLTKTEVNKAC